MKWSYSLITVFLDIDGNGNWCTYDERLHDIATRYGRNSIVYNETLMIINHVKSLGFRDNL